MNDLDIPEPIFHCLECENEIPISRKIKIYCSNRCKDRAKVVRYIRSVKMRGIFNRPDIKNAINEKLIFAYHDGYEPLPNKLRAIVFERDDWTCQICERGIHSIFREGISIADKKKFLIEWGELQIDHIEGHSHDLENLQLLCKGCHRDKTSKNRAKTTRKDNPKFYEFIDSVMVDADRKKPLPQHRKDALNRITKLRFKRKEKYAERVASFVNQHYKGDRAKTHILRWLNLMNVPTYSGNGSWSRGKHNSCFYLMCDRLGWWC